MNAEPLTLLQAAARLGISDKTLVKRIKDGTVRGEKIALKNGGSAWRVWLDDLTSDPTSGSPSVPASGSELQRTPDRDETLALIAPLQHDVEQLKAFIAGDMAGKLHEALASLPSKEDIAAAARQATAEAVAPLVERLEEQAARQERAADKEEVEAREKDEAAKEKDEEAMEEEKKAREQEIADVLDAALAPYISQLAAVADQNLRLREELRKSKRPFWAGWLNQK